MVTQAPSNLATDLSTILADIQRCRLCEESIPEPRPVVRASDTARLLVIGQAPGSRVHASGIPWDDASGKRLRHWLNLDADTFYDESRVAIVPMGFCYPGKGKSGDLPPRPECAMTWHQKILESMPGIRTTLLIGMYAQQFYTNLNHMTLTQRVLHWRDHAPEQFLLPHPSPRNYLWLKRNPWFEAEVVPELRSRVETILDVL